MLFKLKCFTKKLQFVFRVTRMAYTQLSIGENLHKWICSNCKLTNDMNVLYCLNCNTQNPNINNPNNLGIPQQNLKLFL